MWWVKKKKETTDSSKTITDRERFHAFYTSKEWRKLRLYKLAEQPLCEHCLKENLITPAYHVDHVLPLAVRYDLRLSYDNLQCVCLHHHSIKTTTVDNLLKEGKEVIDVMKDLMNFD